MQIKYYNPSPLLTNYFRKELHNLESSGGVADAEEKDNIHYTRNKELQTRLARNKNYVLDHVFQSFVDVLYFFETIEDNYDKLDPLFEADIKDLLGFNDSYTKDQFLNNLDHFQPSHFQNPGGPLTRLVRSILLMNPATKTIKEIDNSDFRTAIALYVFFGNSLDSILDRMDDLDIRNELRHDIRRLRIWFKFLKEQIKDEDGPARRRVGYVYYRFDVTR